jgi:hypothetical protein
MWCVGERAVYLTPFRVGFHIADSMAHSMFRSLLCPKPMLVFLSGQRS